MPWTRFRTLYFWRPYDKSIQSKIGQTSWCFGMMISEAQQKQAPGAKRLARRLTGGNVWFYDPETSADTILNRLSPTPIEPEVMASEAAVGRAMVAEIEEAARARDGDLVIIILGGRGGQAMHRLL